jgi:type VI secretion system secreted protein VgrG
MLGSRGVGHHRLEFGDERAGDVHVHAFRGQEALSGAFRFDVDVSGDIDGTQADDLLGKNAVVEILAGAHRRRFGGLVVGVEKRGLLTDLRRVLFRLRLVPRLWLLRLKRRSRIFQSMRVEDIVTAVLADSRVDSRWLQVRANPIREYCTQYEETDYDFVRRLLSEIGAVFRYEDCRSPTDGVVFSDSPALYLEHDALRLHYTGETGLDVASTEVATSFSSKQRLRPHAAAYREYDFTRPRKLLVSRSEVAAPLEEELEHYEHHAGLLFTKWTYGEEEPGRLLRQLRRRASVAAGASRSPLVQCGHRIALDNHPLPELNAEYAVTKVVHEGWDAPDRGRTEVYRNRFECVPSDVVYCIPRPKRRSVAVSLTATVVGPGAEETHTEPAAQIKVQFHWDREGKLDDRSSCWLRTMQPWAGVGWGTQFIPRVGMEVVVGFDGGDPDKPLVLGSLYNGTHPPPYPLPESATRSGIRTRSTPDSEGYNELAFEDRAGEEEVVLRAERDLNERVVRNHTTTTGGDRFETIDGGETSRVQGNRLHETVGHHVEKTLGDSEQHVGGERRERFGEGRLRHLGYLHRAPSGELDAPTRLAIKEFQEDFGLAPLGELNGPTRAKLGEIHGY